MLTREENDLLCRLEGVASTGQIMRSHWLPDHLSEEVVERNGAMGRTEHWRTPGVGPEDLAVSPIGRATEQP
jgi:hypothetical protein